MRAAPGVLSACSGKLKAAMLPMRSPHTMRLSSKAMSMTRTLTPKGDSACALSAPAGAAVCACMQVQHMSAANAGFIPLYSPAFATLAALSTSNVTLLSISLSCFKLRMSCQLWYYLVGLLQTGSFQKVCSRPEAQRPMQ